VKTKGAVSLLHYLSLFTEVLEPPGGCTLRVCPLQSGGKIAKSKEPTSGLESLSPSHYECSARHLGAAEELTSRTATLYSPKASTQATLNRLLVVTPAHRCRKRRKTAHYSLGTYHIQLPSLILAQ
jgi:hypothetical protein